MIKINFEFDSKTKFLSIKPELEKYYDVWKISDDKWSSESVQYDIDNVKKAKAGTYKRDDGELGFNIGYEGSPGEIFVYNGEKAWVLDAWKDVPPYLELSFDELLDILTQMRDFLLSVGR